MEKKKETISDAALYATANINAFLSLKLPELALVGSGVSANRESETKTLNGSVYDKFSAEDCFVDCVTKGRARRLIPVHRRYTEARV